MICAVLLDFDGTLNDTWRLYLESFRLALEVHYGRRLTDEEILALQPSAERRLLQGVLDPAAYPASYETFLTQYAALHASMNDGLYVGIADMLRALRQRAIRLGIVTGKSRRAWDVTFPLCGLDAFDVVITDDDVERPKPAPEGLLAALARLDIPPAAAFYAGDSVLDAQAAQAAGIRFGAALWSKTPVERAAFIEALHGLGSPMLFHEPADVARHVLASAP